jgi:hypothetical protein
MREQRCCGTASPCGASNVLRRKLLLQTEWLNEYPCDAGFVVATEAVQAP